MELERLRAAFPALQETALERLSFYGDFLAEYNQKVNLTAITDPEGILVKHFEDSLALQPYLPEEKTISLADVGTGAGFPGVVLLIARPDLSLTLIEATEKKLRFLELLLSHLSLSAQLCHRRAEEAGRDPAFREAFDAVSARAVASLPVLSEYCLPLVKPGGRFLAMKSMLAQKELADSRRAIALLGAETEKQIDYRLSNGDARSLIVIKKISQISSKYPRPTSVILKRPL